MAIVIKTNYDFTPSGKRAARYVYTASGNRQLRWYVSGRIFRRGAPAALTAEWLANEGADNHRPQAWEVF